MAQSIVVQSKESSELLISIGASEERIILIHNGVDTEYYKPYSGDIFKLRLRLGLPTEGILVCCVSRLRSLKRIDVIIKAFQQIQKQSPNCNLLIIGSGSERDKLRRLAISVGVSDKVIFQGYVLDTLPYLQAADIFTLSSEKENFSNALLEAMACGLGIVATDVGGNKECIEHDSNGLLVAPNSSDEMADALLYLCNNLDFLASSGQKARHTAINEYSLDNTLDQFLDIYFA